MTATARPSPTRLVLVGLLALGACTEPDRSADSPAPLDPNSTEVPTTDADLIPSDLLGTYDADRAACAQRTTMGRLDVGPDTLRFYYGYATVDAVEVLGDASVDVEATLYQLEGVEEVVPEPATYRLVPTNDGVRLESAYGDPSPLVRCGDSPPGGPSRGGAGVESAYTEIEGCETLRTFEEGGGAEQRCPGVGGVPLFVSEGDLRYDVDAGAPNGAFTTPSGFNSLGTTVEWRLRDGEPFAVIVRYDVEGPGGTAAERRSDLAVIKVGREGVPGCLVGYVPADAAPDQNTAARRLADRDAADYDCDV